MEYNADVTLTDDAGAEDRDVGLIIIIPSMVQTYEDNVECHDGIVSSPPECRS